MEADLLDKKNNDKFKKIDAPKNKLSSEKLSDKDKLKNIVINLTNDPKKIFKNKIANYIR